MIQKIIDSQEKLKFVILSKYDPAWLTMFENSAREIRGILQENCVQIHHIGSTAIPAIFAKPIVDVMPIVKNIHLLDTLNSQFEALGYVCMGEYGISGRRFYWKSKEKRTHNVHVFEEGSPEITRHLAFRDFMNANENYAQAYSLIKRCLAEVFFEDIVNYVEGKGSFVQMMDYKTGMARKPQLEAKDDIEIESYNSAWPKLAEAEIKIIKKFTAYLPHSDIIHFGSTAVPDLSSKPIIDILITIPVIAEAEKWIEPLEALGYVFWDENPDKLHLRFFKGMPPFGFKRTHHIHIVEATHPTVAQRILFRDILRKDAEIRKKYESLKIKLAKQYPHDRETYTNQKGMFIKEALQAHGYFEPIEI